VAKQNHQSQSSLFFWVILAHSLVGLFDQISVFSKKFSWKLVFMVFLLKPILILLLACF